MGDAIKGRHYERFPEEVQLGILLHRHIDFYTDNHPLTLEAVDICRVYCGRFAPVAVDMLFDYFLASDWSDFSKDPLEAYTENRYDTLESFRHLFPEETERIYRHMSAHNWLLSYRTQEGIGNAMTGLGRRIPMKNNLHRAVHALYHDEDALRNLFHDFFPELKASSEEWLVTKREEHRRNQKK